MCSSGLKEHISGQKSWFRPIPADLSNFEKSIFFVIFVSFQKYVHSRDRFEPLVKSTPNSNRTQGPIKPDLIESQSRKLPFIHEGQLNMWQLISTIYIRQHHLDRLTLFDLNDFFVENMDFFNKLFCWWFSHTCNFVIINDKILVFGAKDI